MHLVLALTLAAAAGDLTKTEKNLLGYLPTSSQQLAASGAALQKGCDGEVVHLEIEGATLRLAEDGEETRFAIQHVEATNAGTALKVERAASDKRDPHAFRVEFVSADSKRGTWRVRSDPDGLGAGKWQRTFVDVRKASGLPQAERPAADCP